MRKHAYQLSGSRFLMTSTVLVIVAGTLAAMAFNPFKAMRRAKMVESINNARQVKLVMDGFAMDHEGRYPCEDLAEGLELPKNAKWSNDLFRQVFAGGYINVERIFWVNGAKVCNPKEPDDLTTKDGKFDAAATLQTGDCGWAYVRGQTNVDNPARPILLDACKPGGLEWDRKIWDDKVIVVHIDGSVMAVELNAKGEVLEDGEDILSAKSAIWKDSGQDPAKLLTQPDPFKAAVEKKGAPEPGARAE